MVGDRFWAGATVACVAVAALGVLGVLLELGGRWWWLISWGGGVLLAAVFGRRWEVARKRRAERRHVAAE